ncbi:hypothetical protein BJX63DRAFT_80362 [Aspergillus granulosus]|uniref:Uncharacterized protein n=1 Tax=Aspergillus granulosus TaxID=176169 RepID=A0ABR4GVT1_9EURO
MTFTHRSYTVAWISALPVELAAAKVVLDELHPPLSQPKSDHNVYTLGSVGSHNVVVACLPAGVYGTTSAAAAVSHLMSTYQNVRFKLMVGVGGGVPRENHDIRLGDIAVSKPTGTSSGVIQYDYGKALQTGQFYRTGSLNKPPSLLLKMIAQMESDYMLGNALFSKIMASNLQKAEVRKLFPRPSKDQLFQPTYNHVSGPRCSACDQNLLVVRPERVTDEPHIHYGLVASGNQVMKDAITRDSIAQDQGILCFEMEAAGLMDEIPSLVIRGICDYCDSHKHKEWQPYAAIAAAAYAKAVLMQVPQEQSADMKDSVPEKHHWMVPFQRNLRFVGREAEIAKVEELFKIGQSKIAIYGLGGIGKTQIVLEMAFRMQKRDPNCSVFWIACTSYKNVKGGYMSIAQTVGLLVNPENAKERVKAYLSQESAGKWLLIFDNADDIDMWSKDCPTAPALKRFLPQSQQGHILFTTRNRTLALKLPSSHAIAVPELDQETGMQMLHKSLFDHQQNTASEDAVILLEQLAFVPLAIAQAAAYINENGISTSMYLRLLGNQETQMIELLNEEFEDEHRYESAQNPVATTWWISFQQIQRLNQLAIEYLSFMACIDSRDIPLSLLPPAMSDNEQTKAIGLLNAYSFVSRQADTTLLTLHRLVHLGTRMWLRRNHKLDQQIIKTAHHFNTVFPTGEPENRKRWREYLPHIIALFKEKGFKTEQANYTKLLHRAGQCLYEDGRYKEAEELAVQVLDIRKRVLWPEHPDTLVSIGNLASTYTRQGRWKEAEELQVQVLNIYKRVLRPEHPVTLVSMANLARSYAHQGQWKEAEELEVQVLDIRKRVLGSEHPDTLVSIGNLASTYMDQGRLKEAEELNMQVLNIRKRVLGPEHPDTLVSMGNLALTYTGQGRWRKAEELQVKVLNIRKRVLGPEHPDTLVSIGNLASTYTRQGRWKEAEKLEVQVLDIRKRVLGLEHLVTLVSIGHLASIYMRQGRWKEAEELAVQVLDIRKRVLGPEHPDTLLSMSNLASTYTDQGRWKEAEELAVQVLDIRKRVLGPEHPATLVSIANLARSYAYQGQWKEAEDLEVHVLDIRKRVLGPEHPVTLVSMANLARSYAHQGQWKEAEDLRVQT